MCLLDGQGSITGALLCTSHFRHPKHNIARCIRQNTYFLPFCPLQCQPWMSIPVAPVEHVQLFKVKYSKKKWHTALSLSMHPNRQFPGLFVVHMPLCWHVLLVSCVLCVPSGGGGGGVTLGVFSWGCEDTVVCRWLLFTAGAGGGEGVA